MPTSDANFKTNKSGQKETHQENLRVRPASVMPKPRKKTQKEKGKNNGQDVHTEEKNVPARKEKSTGQQNMLTAQTYKDSQGKRTGVFLDLVRNVEIIIALELLVRSAHQSKSSP